MTDDTPLWAQTQLPTSSLHGSGKVNLVGDKRVAYEALKNAERALGSVSPHSRDYPTPEAFLLAQAIHLSRRETLRRMAEVVMNEALEIDRTFER